MKGVLEFLEASRGGQSFLEQSTLLFLCAIREVSMSRASQPRKQDSAFVSEWMGMWFDMKKKIRFNMLVMAPEHGENLLCFGTISCGFLSFFFFKKKNRKKKQN